MTETKYDFIETDKRILEQKLRRHQLSQQEFHKLLKALPDDKEKGEEHVLFEETEETK